MSSKHFLELYDVIWQGTAFVKYQNPDNVVRERAETAQKQYNSLFYSSN